MSSIPGPAGPSSTPSTSVAPPGWGVPAGLRPEAPGAFVMPATFAPPVGAAAGVPPVSERTSVWWRIATYLIDAGLVWGTVGLLGTLGVLPARFALAVLVGLALWTLVTVGVSTRFPGQTLGKRIAGLQTVKPGVGPIPASTTFIRDVLCWLIYVIPFVIVADAWKADRPERRSIRDHMAGTYVVGAPTPARRRTTLIVMAIALAGLIPYVTFSASITRTGQRTAVAQAARDFVAGCEDAGGPSPYCACVWQQLTRGRTSAEILSMWTGDRRVERRASMIAARDACIARVSPTPPVGA
ncbi:MAG TPA: RDD family protein [Solirubrobacteraceae bacterium]